VSLDGGLAYLIGTLDPFEAATAGGVCVLDHTHDAIHRRSTTSGLLTPSIADGGVRRVGEHRYELDLREDVYFHDGSRVDAEDVAMSIAAMIEAGTTKSKLLGAQLSGIASATPLGGRAVRIDTRDAQPMLDDRLALVRVVPAAFAHVGAADGAPGAGPFRVVAASATEAILEPSAHHRTPGRDSVRLTALVDPEERTEAVLGGGYAAIEDPPVHRHRDILDHGRRLEWIPSQNILWLMFNCAAPRLTEARVRRAIASAIDASELSLVANAGRLTAADSLLPSWHPDHATNAAAPRYDEAQARRLLRDAGLGDGLRLQLTVSSVSWVVDNAPHVVDQLARVGIEAEVRVAHTSELFSREIPSGDYEVLLSSGDPSYFGVDGEFILRWYLSGAWAREYCHFSGPAVDEIEQLLDAARSAETGVRRLLLASVQRLAADAAFIAPIGHRQQPTAWNARMAGFAPGRTTGLSFR